MQPLIFHQSYITIQNNTFVVFPLKYLNSFHTKQNIMFEREDRFFCFFQMYFVIIRILTKNIDMIIENIKLNAKWGKPNV